ncbi:MAG: alpha-amylase [Bacteroidaceae bacterium]|nr:alpha-amylase [Bacteroidaceae bacterium]
MEKAVIYQIFTRLCCNSGGQNIPGGDIKTNGSGKLNSYTPTVLENIKSMGVTHIWFTGLIAHASCTNYKEFKIPVSHPETVKGVAGSPYAIRDYFDIDPDLAESVPDRMAEFQALVDRVHAAGMKFIMDFVPNHVAREYRSIMKPKGVKDLGKDDDPNLHFSPKNNFYYMPGQMLGGEVRWGDYKEFPARATGNDQFSATPSYSDWYETVKLNYGVDYTGGGRHCFDPVPDTWKKMLRILLYWASKGVDAFRCDMAEMVPVDFWHWAVPQVKKAHENIQFIAEIYNPGSYGSYIDFGGFDYIYDKVGLYDTLRAIVESRESATAITRCWQQNGMNGAHMLHFMENHDEQRIASRFFAGNAVKGRPAMIVSALMDGCPIMVYAGQEVGEPGMDREGFSGLDGRTTIFDYWAPDTLSRLYNDGKWDDTRLTDQERELRAFYSTLLGICNKESSIRNGKFFDLMYVNPQSADFNPHRQYAFLRSDGNETILVVTNFTDQPLYSAINIPQHAFDYLELKEKSGVHVQDLISGQEFRINIHSAMPVRVTVPTQSGVAIKWRN